MTHQPEFIAPTRHSDAASALAQAARIYDAGLAHLRDAMQRFVAGEDFTGRVRACYPLVRIHIDTVARADSRQSYGFVAGPGRLDHADAH